MSDSGELFDRYGHLMGADADQDTIRLVGDLDALIARAEPPQRLVTSLEAALHRRTVGRSDGTPSPTGAPRARRLIPARRPGRGEQRRATNRWTSRAVNAAGLLLFVLIAGTIAFGLSAVLPRMQPGQPAAGDHISYASVEVDRQGLMGEVIAFDRTGRVHKRLETGYQPDMAASPDGTRLFVLDSEEEAGGLTHKLSLIDTGAWKTLDSTPIRDRMLYPVTGPSALVVSPDGARLYVYSYRVLGPDAADFWLTVVDTRTLRVLPARIPLPRCGAARFSTVGGQVLALCSEDRTLRFIDPKATRVAASLPIDGTPAGLAVAEDRREIYIVTNDLRIVEVDASTRTVTRQVGPGPAEAGSVHGLYSVALDGDRLVVGLLSRPRDTESPFALRVFEAPSLRLVRSAPLPHYTSFAAAPGGGLYTFAMGDSANQDWGIARLDPDSSEISPLLDVDGPVHRIVP